MPHLRPRAVHPPGTGAHLLPGLQHHQLPAPGGEVRIPQTIRGKKVVTIGAFAFIAHESLTSVSIPRGVTSIEAWAFMGCTNLPLLQKMKLKMVGAM
ncbi:MAG: leucine-rich repeat protein [Clostridia bacterium]|nr:leucine-rich repeat protein [Clostridia bacterium]